MCLVKVKDFGEALGISGGTIRSKISRGQLCCNKNKLIDTEHPINFSYLLEVNGGNQKVFEPFDIKPVGRANVNKSFSSANKKQTKVSVPTKSGLKSENSVLAKPSKNGGSVKSSPAVNKKPVEKYTPTKMTAEERFDRDVQKRHNQKLLEIDLEKKEADLRLIQRRGEITQMQLEKSMGNTLPLDKCISVMAINFKAVFKVMHSQLKNMTSTMVQNLGGTKEDYNNIMAEMEKHLNYIKETSQKNANDDIELLIQEYSEVRSRGERKL